MANVMKPPTPDKYKDKAKQELIDALVKRDAKEQTEQIQVSEGESRAIRLGAAASSAVATGLAYEKWPWLENLFGTSASADHILALGCGVGAFIAKADNDADFFEGICSSALSNAMRKVGRSVGGISLFV